MTPTGIFRVAITLRPTEGIDEPTVDDHASRYALSDLWANIRDPLSDGREYVVKVLPARIVPAKSRYESPFYREWEVSREALICLANPTDAEVGEQVRETPEMANARKKGVLRFALPVYGHAEFGSGFHRYVFDCHCLGERDGNVYRERFIWQRVQ